MIEFALNPATQETADQIVYTICARQDLDWFALLDTAFDYGKPGFPLPPDAVNCFEGVIFLDDMKMLAPVLIPVGPSVASERVPPLIEHRDGHCDEPPRDGRPMLSFLGVEKGLTAAELVEQWKGLHFVYPEDGERYLLRIADTRTLAKMPKFLEVEQWQALHQNIAEWHIIGRRGKLEEILLEKTDKRLPFKLNLTEKQFAKMVELDEPDNAISSINQLQLDIIPEDMTGYRFFDLASQMLWKTKQYGITSWNDIISLAILAVGTNGEILDDSDVDAWMQAKDWEEGKIGNVLYSAPCFARWRD